MTEHLQRHRHGPARYQFLVDSELSPDAAAAFPELEVTRGPAGGTALYGSVRDESHLHGILARFQTLNLAVVEFRRLPD